MRDWSRRRAQEMQYDLLPSAGREVSFWTGQPSPLDLKLLWARQSRFSIHEARSGKATLGKRGMTSQRNHRGYSVHWYVVIRAVCAVDVGSFGARRRGRLDYGGAAPASCLRTAYLSGRWLSLDARLKGLRL